MAGSLPRTVRSRSLGEEIDTGQKECRKATLRDCLASVRADATLSGLLPGALYLVEMRTVTKDGTSEWSEPFRFRAE
jgi:hypothetical protein